MPVAVPFWKTWLHATLNDPDNVKAERAVSAMVGVVELDIAVLEPARDGK